MTIPLITPGGGSRDARLARGAFVVRGAHTDDGTHAVVGTGHACRTRAIRTTHDAGYPHTAHDAGCPHTTRGAWASPAAGEHRAAAGDHGYGPEWRRDHRVR